MADPPITTLAQIPFHLAGRFPAMRVRRCTREGFSEMDAREFFERVRDISLGLAGLGVKPGDRVGLVCETRPEWLLADLAILTTGAATVPVYPTLPADMVGFILADAGVETVIVSTETQAHKIREAQSELPSVTSVVVVDRRPAPDREHSPGSGKERLLEVGLDEVAARGHERLQHEDGLARIYREAAHAIESNHLATIIYTSGTTGVPKGVMLTHGAILANVVDADQMVPVDESDEALSFLPLCHALERTVVYLYLYKGVSITFAESLETVGRDLARAHPTMMTGVPRVFEKLHARVLEAVAASSSFRQWLFQWALDIGAAQSRARLAGETPSLVVRLLHPVADRLVLSKIRDRVGGRLRFAVSGGAPLSRSVAEFLFAIGVPVLEGYGLTETAPVLTVNPAAAPRIGTVGKALPRVELKIAEDGEVLARGPNLMVGYYGRPDATEEAIRDGWFHTGDIGHLDKDGYLTITDRKKELLVTAGGKNIAPQPIEQRLKQNPVVAEAMLVGDGRPFVVGLIVPDFAALTTRLGVPEAMDHAQVVSRDDVRQLFQQVVDEVNRSLPRHEQLKRFALLPAEFTQATGELTPTLKLKRRVVTDRWKDTIESLYAI